jgi:hypothetical protein
MRIWLSVFLLFMAGCTNLGSSKTSWNDVLSKCVDSNLIGENYLFFGVTNSVGPGSIWRYADDKSVRLLYELSDAIPSEEVRSKLVNISPVATCKGDTTTKWGGGINFPFSLSNIQLTGELGALLSRSSSLSVSVDGVGIDSIKETPWKKAFRDLGKDDIYFAELMESNRVIASNVVKVTGLRSIYTFNSQLGADIQAKLIGTSFTIGKDASGASAVIESQNPTSFPVKSCTGTASQVPLPNPVTAKGITIHAEIISDTQIMLCSQGPIYLLAGYSKIDKGVPLGIGPKLKLDLVPLSPSDVSSVK